MTAPPDRLLAAGELRRVLITLCLTEITSYGVLYYAFPVMAGPIHDDTGWATTTIMAVFTGAQLVAAGVGIPIGRRVDGHGPRTVMTAGSLLAVVATLAVAAAPSLPLFVAAWLTAGVGMGMILYTPAFIALTRWYGPRRVQALTWLTITAGLSSTVFAPLTSYLLESFDWRETYLILAVTLAIIIVPAHWWGLRAPWPPADTNPQPPPDADGRAAPLGPFIAITVALSLASFAAFAVLINLIPLLMERGIDAQTAALTLGLGGVGQVAGRLTYPLMSRWLGIRERTVLVIAASAAAIALLGLLTNAFALIMIAIGAGVARGLMTLVQATAVSDRWGVAHYGRLTGILSAAVTVCVALAPWAGAGIAELIGGYAHAFLILGALGAGALLFSFTRSD